MTDLAPILQGFFTDRLARQKKASPHTVAAYRDTCRLLLVFAQDRTGKAPSRLSLADLDTTLIGAFLHHLEERRGNGSATRNARLAAIHSLLRYAAPRAPEHSAVISQVLAITPRRRERAIVSYLTPEETDALLAAPDRETWHGRRDHALLLLAVQTGLRVSELTGLTVQDAHLRAGPHARCHGKGRKDRATPLTGQTVKVLTTWLREFGLTPAGPLFPTRAGGRLSRDAVERLVAKHTATAEKGCPSINGKNVTPHTLRHTGLLQQTPHITHIDDGFVFLGFSMQRRHRGDGRRVVLTIHVQAGVGRGDAQDQAGHEDWYLAAAGAGAAEDQPDPSGLGRLLPLWRVQTDLLLPVPGLVCLVADDLLDSSQAPASDVEQTRRRYYGADRIREDKLVLYDAAKMRVERYRYRYRRSPRHSTSTWSTRRDLASGAPATTTSSSSGRFPN